MYQQLPDKDIHDGHFEAEYSTEESSGEEDSTRKDCRYFPDPKQSGKATRRPQRGEEYERVYLDDDCHSKKRRHRQKGRRPLQPLANMPKAKDRAERHKNRAKVMEEQAANKNREARKLKRKQAEEKEERDDEDGLNDGVDYDSEETEIEEPPPKKKKTNVPHSRSKNNGRESVATSAPANVTGKSSNTIGNSKRKSKNHGFDDSTRESNTIASGLDATDGGSKAKTAADILEQLKKAQLQVKLLQQQQKNSNTNSKGFRPTKKSSKGKRGQKDQETLMTEALEREISKSCKNTLWQINKVIVSDAKLKRATKLVLEDLDLMAFDGLEGDELELATNQWVLDHMEQVGTEINKHRGYVLSEVREVIFDKMKKKVEVRIGL